MVSAFMGKWTYLENTILSEINGTYKLKYHMVSLMRVVQNENQVKSKVNTVERKERHSTYTDAKRIQRNWTQNDLGCVNSGVYARTVHSEYNSYAANVN